MKEKITILLLFLFSISTNAQDMVTNKTPEKFRLIAGARVNPLIIYQLDGEGTKAEFIRLHAEIGALFHKKFYTSVGYTPYVNSIYNYNEYWFIGLDKKLPVSMVLGAEYMFDNNKAIIQAGPNFKLGKIGNAFIFAFSPTNKLEWGLKVGVFIPLNVVLMKN